jgi:hypothetical protein
MGGIYSPAADGNNNGAIDAGDYDVWKSHYGDVSSGNIAGDYNNDGAVDAADYTVWRNAMGGLYNPAADGNNNGVIDLGDYDVWKSGYGELLPGAGGGGLATVPEPAAAVFVVMGLVCGFLGRSRCR